MMIWSSYGSEHSAGLVLIGRFHNTERARVVSDLLSQYEARFGGRYSDDPLSRFPDEDLEFFSHNHGHNLRPDEVEQFSSGIRHDQEGDTIRIDTDEGDLSAFIKLIVNCGGRVEFFSRHDYPQGDDEDNVSENTQSP